MSGVFLAWLLEVGLIGYRDVKGGRTVNGLPFPGDFLVTFVIFGTLAAVGSAPSARTFANVFAWGVVAATASGLIDPAAATLGKSLGPAAIAPPSTTKKAA